MRELLINRHTRCRKWHTATKWTHKYRLVYERWHSWLHRLAKTFNLIFSKQCRVLLWRKHTNGFPGLRDDTLCRVWTDSHRMLLRTLEAMSWCVWGSGWTVSLLRVLKLLEEEAEQNIYFGPWHTFTLTGGLISLHYVWFDVNIFVLFSFFHHYKIEYTHFLLI